jgi:hypothetical protein
VLTGFLWYRLKFQTYGKRWWQVVILLLARLGINLIAQWMKKMWHISIKKYYSAIKKEWNPVTYHLRQEWT